MKRFKVLLKSIHTQNGILFFLVLFFFILSNSFLLTWYQKTPPGTTFTFAHGHTGDYYQFLHFIQSGIQKQFLYDIPYTEKQLTPFILQPVYYLSGFLMSPFTQSPITIFFVLRIISFCVFSFSLVRLINRCFNSFPMKLAATVVILTATGVLSSIPEAPFYRVEIDWNDTFHVFRKFVIPPHHLFAISCIMHFIVEFSKSKTTNKQILFTSILTFMVGFLHTFHLSIIVMMVSVWSFFKLIQSHKNFRYLFIKSFPILFTALCVYLYYNRMTLLVYPWTRGEETSIIFELMATELYKPYLVSVGLPLFFSVFFIFPLLAKKANTISILLLLWGILPFIAFVFRISQGFIQPYKTHQYIPLALLSILGIQFLVQKKTLFIYLIPLVVAGSLLYSIPPYLKILQYARGIMYEDPTIYMPDSLRESFQYLSHNTSPKSVVLAGHNTSYMIPAFTHNKVIIGQGNSIPNYPAAVDSVARFFYEPTSPEEKKQFLEAHAVSYILFSYESPTYERLFKQLPFLQEEYKNEENVIVKVVRSQ